jgi:flagellar basal-body rod protein FlgC
MFPTISIAGSGLSVDQTWIDTIGGNIANAQDNVTPGQPVYREQSVEVAPLPNVSVTGQVGPGSGVHVEAINLSAGKGILTYDPTNPIANKQGYVLSPNINMGHELTTLVEAQVNYEADATVLQNSDTAYKNVLSIKA